MSNLDHEKQAVKNNEKMVFSKSDESADFETAISKTGFGNFNLLLIFVAMAAIMASQSEIGVLAYAFPAAQCDLDISLEDKGLVNAIIYVGMMVSSFLWGALVDVFGRRKILIISHLLDYIFALMATFAPNFVVLIVAKFLGGFIINGPILSLLSLMSEFHGTKYRPKVPLIIGLLYNFASVILPLLAWVILPLDIEFTISNSFKFHSWNLYLLICSIPSLLTGIIFIFMPESPKYLMSQGNNEKALKVFQKVYKINTHKPAEEYPVKKLIDDKQIHHEKRGFKETWYQISPLFTTKYLTNLLLCCLQIFLLMMVVNPLCFWLPQIFQIVNDFSSDQSSSFCEILNTISPSEDDNREKSCSMNFDNASVYINSMIVGAVAIASYLSAVFCINKTGKKRILLILGTVSGTGIICIYLAPNPTIALVLICTLTLSFVCIDVVFAITVDVFPTYLRASAISLVALSGRIGSVVGNLVMPSLLQLGCVAAFCTPGALILLCTLLSILLPKTEQKALE